jgi:hypothetical protein
VKEEVEEAFEKFLEQKKDSLNVAAAEPAGWGFSAARERRQLAPPRRQVA